MLSRRFLTLAALFVAGVVSAEEAPKYWVYIGTSTGAKSTSKGIYRCEFDPAHGKLWEPELVAEVVNPTFLAVHPSKKFLYCVGEVNATGGKKAGGVHAFTLDAKNGELKKLNDSDSGGPGPCHVMTDREGKCLLVANYAGGSVKCLKLADDGSIGKESTFHQHPAGSNAVPNRQKEAHAHSTHVSPDNKYAVVADLGMDKLVVYKLDPTAGKIESHGAFETAKGAGPRHFAWHPNGKWAYTNGELDFTVTAMKFDDGTFTKLNVSPTLPAETPQDIRAKNSTAEIVVHPKGRHVFVSNRGHNSLAIFKVNDDGSLTPSGHVTGDITIPRNFNIDPSGRWILVANQDGKSVTVFEWDDEKGEAKATGHKIAIDRPMCIKFVPKQ